MKITANDLARLRTQRTFVEYLLDFYGAGGIYDFGVTEKDILIATGIRMNERPDLPFEGDSLDREIVRDIMERMKEEAA